MKKSVLLIFAAILVTSCGGKTISNDGSLSDSNNSLSQNSFSFGPHIPITSVSSTSTSKSSTSINHEDPVIDGELAQELIVYSSSVDILKAKSSVDLLLATGFDNGQRYEQNQTINYTSYENEITIGEGSLTHVQQGKTYTDTFDHVKMLKDYTYIDAKQYHNHIFNDTTEKSNCLNSENPTQAYSNAVKMVSCGAGYLAFEDFYYIAITLGCEVSYDAVYEEDSRLHITFYAEAENSQSNQKFVGTYDYYFNNKDEGFLNEYHAEQAFYSLDRYLVEEDPSTLTPMYYAKEVMLVTAGTKTEFKGTLPIDIDSSFVKSITLKAAITTIEIDEVVALKAIIEPKSATDKSLKFVSSNESVARVDYSGRVTGISKGTCTIYALNYASGVEGHIDITVIEKHPLDPGDDFKKGDLKEALELALNQYLPVENIYHDTIVGMIIDEDLPLNGEAISKLSISDFAFDEVTRTATYCGDLKALEEIIPFKDNGISKLSNRYYFDRTSHIYRDTILGMKIELTAQNQIGVITFKMRTDSCDKPADLDLNSLTNENVDEKLGEFSSGYSRNVVYESEGFYSTEEEEEF